MDDHPDPHLEWARQAADLERQAAALPGEDGDRLFAEFARFRDLISTAPARTLAGAREQVLLAIREHEEGVLSSAKATGLRNAAATLERLADEGRASAMTGAASHHPRRRAAGRLDHLP